jgi:hypothetical protein
MSCSFPARRQRATCALARYVGQGEELRPAARVGSSARSCLREPQKVEPDQDVGVLLCGGDELGVALV